MSCRFNIRLLLLAAVSGWLAPFSFTQDTKSHKDAAKHVSDGHHARQHGEFDKAVDSYTKARQAFQQQGLPPQEANAALHLGETLQDQAKHEPADKDRLKERPVLRTSLRKSSFSARNFSSGGRSLRPIAR